MLTTAQKTRLFFVVMGFLMITCLLWGRLFWLQVLHPDHWLTIARRQHFQMLELLPVRGDILDRNGKPLAVSIRLTSVFANPRHVKDPQRIARRLAPVLNQPVDELLAKLSNKERGFVWLARRIPNQTASLIRRMRLPGVDLVMEPRRVYPQGYLASHVIGCTDMDTVGLEGLELAYNQILRGEPGWRWMARDARRRSVGAWEAPAVAPRDGLHLVLTVDSTIQFFAEQELERAFEERNAKGGCVVVMDPFTGEVLALANRPTFDPNLFSKADADHRRNRAVTDMFEPGSVFKVITAATALGKGVVRPTDRFFCENGEFPIPGGHILHDHMPHGWLTFRQVITNSSNIGTAKVAMRLGPASLYQGIKAFGFGMPTGVGLPGEVAGIAKTPMEWSKTSITAIPMGQEVTVTAMQLAQAISVVANGGVLMKPYIIKEIRDPSGALVHSSRPEAVRRVIPSAVAAELKEILAGVVEEGTGKMAAVPGYRSAGKTGTAQKIEPTGGYSHSKFMASFIGFVPVEKPRLTIVVVLDEPRPVYYGGVVAAPVFKKVAADTLGYLQVPYQSQHFMMARSDE
ncbi:MAG: penicillin-binding transpeptidase domain-containing protein [Candidatus Omnitrophica bacterium]|nr:penicillin-binding transpeptidase domain-containing protein [Candidatus Omnitrophota bacterium]